MNNDDLLMYQIISGEKTVEVSGRKYKIINPDISIKLESIEIYNDIIRSNRFDTNWLTDQQCLNLMVYNKLCTLDIDENIKKIEKEIDDKKVALYQSFFNKDHFVKTEKIFKQIKNKYLQMLNIRHSYDYLTLRGFADMAKSQYVLYHSLFYNGERLWKSTDEIDVFLLDSITNKIISTLLSTSDIRRIARSNEWRSYWNIKKENVFDIPVFNLTDDQKSLILFTRMYDAASEHPECPTKEALANDDVFDGWMIHEERQREKEHLKSLIDKKLNKGNERKKKADEMYMMVNTHTEDGVQKSIEELQQEIDMINMVNDPNAEAIKRQRAATIQKYGVAKDSDFSDRKVQIQQKANQQFIQHLKGKK